jgi:hypothetical protein
MNASIIGLSRTNEFKKKGFFFFVFNMNVQKLNLHLHY